MKEATKSARQGEAVFFAVDAVPEGAKEVKPQAGHHVVAHSETGHHHIIGADGVTMWEHPTNPLVCFLRMETVTQMDVEHLRAHDTHETLRLLGKPGKVWQRNIQREWTPDGWRRVAD